MKRISLIISILTFIIFNDIHGQDDSVVVHKEYINSLKTDTFNYVQNAYINKKNQFGISFYAAALENYSPDFNISDEAKIYRHIGCGLKASFEKKIFDYHSLKVSAVFYVGNYSYKNVQITCDYRYYFDLQKRISLALTGNSFSANYIGIRQMNWVRISPFEITGVNWSASAGAWEVKSVSRVSYYPAFKLFFGTQREFNKHLISDFNCGLFILPETITSNISVYLEYTIGYNF